MKPSRLIAEADRLRIEEAVRAAEAETAGEIVVSVARDSDAHKAAPWRLAALLAVTALLGADVFFPEASLLEILAAQTVAATLGHVACRIDAIRRAFVSEAECQRSAELAALHHFSEQGIRRTRGRTGILIYVGLLEHRVVVLGDEAVDHALGPDERWEDVVSLVLTGIQRGRAVDGILAAIARCGEMLRHPLPVAADDRDEIPHGLVLED